MELPSSRQVRSAVQRFRKRSIGILTNSWNTLNQFRVWIAKKMYRKLPDSLKRIVKKIGRIEARIHKKLVCMQPRLMRRYGLLKYPEGISVRTLKEKKNGRVKLKNHQEEKGANFYLSTK